MHANKIRTKAMEVAARPPQKPKPFKFASASEKAAMTKWFKEFTEKHNIGKGFERGLTNSKPEYDTAEEQNAQASQLTGASGWLKSILPLSCQEAALVQTSDIGHGQPVLDHPGKGDQTCHADLYHASGGGNGQAVLYNVDEGDHLDLYQASNGVPYNDCQGILYQASDGVPYTDCQGVLYQASDGEHDTACQGFLDQSTDSRSDTDGQLQGDTAGQANDSVPVEPSGEIYQMLTEG